MVRLQILVSDHSYGSILLKKHLMCQLWATDELYFWMEVQYMPTIF